MKFPPMRAFAFAKLTVLTFGIVITVSSQVIVSSIGAANEPAQSATVDPALWGDDIEVPAIAW